MNPRPWTRPLVAAGVGLALAAGTARGASHREAPLMTLDPAADITDVYAFVSYDQANLDRQPADRKVTLIMNVIPGQEPSSGPNYYAFDDNVLYEIKVDNDRDGDASDIIYQLRFQTETRSPDQFIATLGGGPLPPISAIDGPGSEGLSRVQRYTVTELRDCKENAKGPKCASRTVLFGGQLQPTVPSNIGPRTMPQYDTLRQQGIGPTPRPASASSPARTPRPPPSTWARARHHQPARRERVGHPDGGARRCRSRPRRRTPTTSSTRSASTPSAASTSTRSPSRCRSAASPRRGNPPAPQTARSASAPARRARWSAGGAASRVRCRRASRC